MKLTIFADLIDGSVKGSDEDNKKARTEETAIVSFTNEEDEDDSDFDYFTDDELEDLDDSQLFLDAVDEKNILPAVTKTPPLPANPKTSTKNMMVGFTTPKKSTLKSSAKAKMSTTPTNIKKKSTPGSKKKTAMGYEEYLASKMSNVNITKAEEGVSRVTSGTGTSCLILPTIKWIYTTTS